MLPFLTTHFANPSSGYSISRHVKRAVDTAREQVAALLGSHPDEIIFTSGGTEADNTALASATACLPERKHLIISAVEHPAVEQFVQMLEAEHGYTATRLPVDEFGQINLDQLEAAIQPDQTALTSLMWANNETGVTFPIADIAQRLTQHGIYLHTDAVNAIGKVPINVKETGVHFLALSAHKFHGPKGVGALYADANVRLKPRFIGGAQERNRRGGTENVASIVGLGKAAELMQHKLASNGHLKVGQLRDRLENGLKQRLPDVRTNGHPEHRLSNTASLAFDGIEAAGLLIMLDEDDLCASAGSACHTGSLQPSGILTAMGYDRERALSTLRLSLSGLTTEAEIDRAIDLIATAVAKLRALRPSGQVVVSS